MESRPDDELIFAPKAPGSFQRGKNNLQRWITPGGKFALGADRYHLFVNYGCGWCHQCMLVRSVKGLQKAVSMSHTGITTLGKRGTETYVGWEVPTDPTGNGMTSAYDVYNKGMDYGRKQMTTPMLFDKETKEVVSNDPAHIMLMLNEVFNDWAEHPIDLYPEELRKEIEDVNAVVFPGINDGVYRCWFPATEEAYSEGFNGLRNAFKWVEERLKTSEYLCGNRLTLADLRAFPHLFRFDVIYHKLMLRDPRGDYLKDAHPSIVAWLHRLFSDPAVQTECDLVVAARFYLSEPDDECDALYAALKLPWMPTLEELEVKRSREGLAAPSVGKPTVKATSAM